MYLHYYASCPNIIEKLDQNIQKYNPVEKIEPSPLKNLNETCSGSFQCPTKLS